MRSLRCNGGSPYYGYNVDFIAQYLYEHPGAGMTEVRRALALSRGMPKLPDGWMTDYFYHNRKYYTSYAGVLWERVDPENRRRGWKLTLEGYGRVKNP
jgi:hypothetical protein